MHHDDDASKKNSPPSSLSALLKGVAGLSPDEAKEAAASQRGAPNSSNSSIWKEPAWETPINKADRVDLLGLPDKDMISAENWPETFFGHVRERRMLTGADAQRVITLFKNLQVNDPARCHMPPWGFAFYAGETLLFTVTLCYRCTNAYVYTKDGKILRGFTPSSPAAVELRAVLEQYLPLSE